MVLYGVVLDGQYVTCKFNNSTLMGGCKIFVCVKDSCVHQKDSSTQLTSDTNKSDVSVVKELGEGTGVPFKYKILMKHFEKFGPSIFRDRLYDRDQILPDDTGMSG